MKFVTRLYDKFFSFEGVRRFNVISQDEPVSKVLSIHDLKLWLDLNIGDVVKAPQKKVKGADQPINDNGNIHKYIIRNAFMLDAKGQALPIKTRAESYGAAIENLFKIVTGHKAHSSFIQRWDESRVVVTPPMAMIKDGWDFKVIGLNAPKCIREATNSGLDRVWFG